MLNTAPVVERVEQRLSHLINAKLPTNHRGEISAAVLRDTLKSLVSGILSEVER